MRSGRAPASPRARSLAPSSSSAGRWRRESAAPATGCHRRAREGALPEAEQLRLEQLFRDRRAVHRDERLVAPSAREVERAREQLLANARLAVDQHGRVEPGNRVEQLEDVLHHLALREDVLEREPRSEEHTSELQSRGHLVCRLLLEKKKAC